MLCTGGTKLTEAATLNRRLGEKTIHKQRVRRPSSELNIAVKNP